MEKLSKKCERALQLGVAIEHHDSFELNQSCPTLGRVKRSKKLETTLKGFAKFTGDEISSYSYGSKDCGDGSDLDLEASYSSMCESRSKENSRPHSRLSLGASWSSMRDVEEPERSNFNVKTSTKAILTIDAETSTILTANKQACCLFDHTSESLLKMKLTDLFKKPPQGSTSKQAFMQAINDSQGSITVVSGKVMEVMTRRGDDVAVSVWVKRLENYSGKICYIVALEPVVRFTGKFVFNEKGDIISCDDQFAQIHGYLSSSELQGTSIDKLMPSYEMPEPGARLNKNLRKQRTTSTTVDGQRFPVSLYIHSQDKDENNVVRYTASVWLFTNISGPITLTSTGSILNVNSNFSLALLGYTSFELKNKDISELLPDLLNNTGSRGENFLSSGEVDASLIHQEELKDSDISTIVAKSSESESTKASFGTFEEIANPALSSSGSCEGLSPPSPKVSKPNLSQSKSSSNSALHHINSLLLGQCTPITTQRKAEHDKLSPPPPQDVNNSSWVELSMSDARQEEQSDAIKKINLLLNTSMDALQDQAIVVGKGTDSAVLSTSETCEHPTCSSSQDKSSFPSSFSGYQSGEDSLHPEDTSNDKLDVDKENKTVSFEINSKPLHPKPPSVTTKDPLLSLNSGNVTSTPLATNKSRPRVDHTIEVTEGYHEGQARHKDGSLIAVKYEVRYLATCNLYCIWLGLGLENHKRNPSLSSDQTLYSSFNSTLPSLNASAVSGMLDYSLGSAIKQEAQRLNESSRNVLSPREGTEEWQAIQGKFSEKYKIESAIGSGAFGFVRTCCQKRSCEQVAKKTCVVKFIRKEKVLEECWVDDFETASQIPLEIALLTKLNHPNIVKVLDFYENELFFAMVMPQHGKKGVDLFEFIDREPKLDERLASYIFRQIASAVYYLSQEGIVHRDIKDENVIIDETFACKLIDFGSAAFYKPGKTFGTFCGTMEYCSPEVLLGERYEGPALEIWALGVTLYTLVFGENPFHDIEETVDGVLKPPSILSNDLMSLIQWMLQPVPEHRCTITDVVEHMWVNMPIDVGKYSWDRIVPAPAKQNSSQQPQKPSDTTGNGSQYFEDSILSSSENLAAHMKHWKDGKPDRSEATKPGKLPFANNARHLAPIMRSLENVKLNKSI